MNNSRFSLICLFAIVLTCLLSIYSCAPDGHPQGWQTLDLLEHGVPVTILAPPAAEVKKGGLQSTLINDLTIVGGSSYNVQLFYSAALTNDIAKLKNDLLQSVKANRYFNRVVREDVAGFIYESRIDSTASYGFRLVKLQGDLELSFQSGFSELFSLEQAELMYDAVK